MRFRHENNWVTDLIMAIIGLHNWDLSRAIIGLHSDLIRAIIGLHWNLSKAIIGLHWNLSKAIIGLHWNLSKAIIGLHWNLSKAIIGLHWNLSKAIIGLHWDLSKAINWGWARLLSGRVLDRRSRGCWFDPHQSHSIVSLSKTLYPLLSTGSTQEDPSDMTEK